jgi:hypothetical protein
MSWELITEGLKQVIAKVASPRGAGSKANPTRDASYRADAFGGARYQETQLPPYVPDSHRERSDSSLHLSC